MLTSLWFRFISVNPLHIIRLIELWAYRLATRVSTEFDLEPSKKSFI